MKTEPNAPAPDNNNETQGLLAIKESETPITKLTTKVILAHLFVIGPSITTLCTLFAATFGLLPGSWLVSAIAATVGAGVSLLISALFLGIEILIARSINEHDQKTARILFMPTILISKLTATLTNLISTFLSRLKNTEPPCTSQSLERRSDNDSSTADILSTIIIPKQDGSTPAQEPSAPSYTTQANTDPHAEQLAQEFVSESESFNPRNCTIM